MKGRMACRHLNATEEQWRNHLRKAEPAVTPRMVTAGTMDGARAPGGGSNAKGFEC